MIQITGKNCRRVAVWICFMCLLGGIVPGTAAGCFAGEPELKQNPVAAFFTGSGDVFSLNAAKESVLLGSGIALNAAVFAFKPDKNTYTGGKQDLDSVNGFDRWAACAYSHSFDVAGSVFHYAAALTPAVLFSVSSKEWGTIGTMYLESVLLCYGLSESTKAFVHRYRPYMYFDGYADADGFDSGEYEESWYSGHTARAFNGAVFAGYVFSQYYPDSKWKIPVIAGSMTLAAGTAVSRIMSGNHFLSDVLTGAVIGSASGFLVPFMHRIRGKSGALLPVDIAAIPNGFMVTYRY